jgi:hypothetical protein
MMDDDRFWALVDAAREAAGDDVEDRVAGLEQALLALEPSELVGFQRKYDELLARAYRWDLWGAAFVIEGGCSDDGFRHFRDWLISEGEAAYDAALADPDSLADLESEPPFELEAFGYVAAEVYEQVADEEMPRGRAAEPAEPLGKPWEEDELPAMFPRLARRHAG